MPRKRQPTAVVEANGRKHLSQAEKQARLDGEVVTPKPTNPSGRVTWPRWLPKELREEFNAISKQLVMLGIFCDLDKDTLAQYLMSRQHWLDAEEQLSAALTAGDQENADQWGKIQDRHFRQCRACAGDLGLTITSRCKLVVPQKPDVGAKTDPFLVLLEGRKKA